MDDDIRGCTVNITEYRITRYFNESPDEITTEDWKFTIPIDAKMTVSHYKDKKMSGVTRRNVQWYEQSITGHREIVFEFKEPVQLYHDGKEWLKLNTRVIFNINKGFSIENCIMFTTPEGYDFQEINMMSDSDHVYVKRYVFKIDGVSSTTPITPAVYVVPTLTPTPSVPIVPETSIVANMYNWIGSFF